MIYWNKKSTEWLLLVMISEEAKKFIAVGHDIRRGQEIHCYLHCPLKVLLLQFSFPQPWQLKSLQLIQNSLTRAVNRSLHCLKIREQIQLCPLANSGIMSTLTIHCQ